MTTDPVKLENLLVNFYRLAAVLGGFDVEHNVAHKCFILWVKLNFYQQESSLVINWLNCSNNVVLFRRLKLYVKAWFGGLGDGGGGVWRGVQATMRDCIYQDLFH